MKIEVEKVDREVSLPEYSHYGEDAGLDLRSTEDIAIPSGDWCLVRTGIKIAIPKGFVGFINPRSGLALKYGITVLNADGVIDPGYRGEVGVILINHGDYYFVIEKGDRIAQLVIQRYEQIEWKEVEDLDKTKRGEGGFGYTGKK